MKIEDFYIYLTNNSGDWEYRSVFADWLFDHNNPLEKVQRWLIKEKKHPIKIKMEARPYKIQYIFGNSGLYYYDEYINCCLPKKIFDRLKGTSYCWSYYDSMKEAEESLLEVLLY